MSSDWNGMISPEKSLDYHEIARIITGLKKVIRKYKSRRIAVYSGNSMAAAIAALSLIDANKVSIMLNVRETKENIGQQLKMLKCRIVISDDDDFTLPGKTIISLRKLSEKFDNYVETEHEFLSMRMEIKESGAIFFTSGSSSMPKAVFHTWDNLENNAYGANANIPLKEGDKYLLSLPLYHVGGFGILERCLCSQSSLVFPNPALSLEENILQSGITHISLVATQLQRLMETELGIDALKQLKHVLLGGGPVNPDLVSRALSLGIRLHTSYGSTEMASQICTTSAYDIEELMTAGLPLEGRELKIDKNNEILVRGKTLSQGYVKGNDIIPMTDAAGWFHTGDRGMLDSKGRLIVNGRIDNMFISGGENIYPEEIEKALESIDFIKMAVVVSLPNEEYGLRPVAFIESTVEEIPDRIEFKKLLADKLAGFKIPDYFYKVPDTYTQKGIKPDRQYFKKLAETML